MYEKELFDEDNDMTEDQIRKILSERDAVQWFEDISQTFTAS